MTTDATRLPVKLEVFRSFEDVREQERLEQYIGREQHFSLARDPVSKTFILRAHDEVCHGGYKLALEATGAAQIINPPVAPDDIPQMFDLPSDMVVLDLDLSGGDYDASAYKPLGLVHGAIVRLRKLDQSAHKIVFTDHTGVTYSFVNRYSEFITLQWHEILGEFIVT